MTSTWSLAVVRLQYTLRSPSGAGGLSLSPYPRMSGTTTVYRSASAGATLCHITCVCG